MLKPVFIASTLLILTNCGGSGGSGSDTDSSDDFDPFAQSERITSDGNNTSISGDGPVDLDVSGSDNTITVNVNLSDLRVTGSRNLFIFTASTDIADCDIIGDDNTAETGTGAFANIGCTVTGSGNEGF